MVLEKLIAELTDILKREIRSFTIILELLILEEKSLVECDSKGLATILERQDDIFSSIACLEKSRMDVLGKIADLTDVSPETITISKLTESVDTPLRKELVENGHILARLNEDIQRKKTLNTMLINQSIMLVESDIRLILSAVSRDENKEAVYNSRAISDGTSKSVCIDERI